MRLSVTLRRVPICEAFDDGERPLPERILRRVATVDLLSDRPVRELARRRVEVMPGAVVLREGLRGNLTVR